MTVPSGPVVFNNDTGSDSAASGLGPDTVVAGTFDVTSGSSTLANGVTSSGNIFDINVGDLIYITTSSGRKFSIIQGINLSLGEFYTDDNWDVTETANWYVGGKRATIDSTDSRRLLTTDNPGSYDFKVQLENTGTDYAVTSSIVFKYLVFEGADRSNPTGITFNQNSYLFGGNAGLNNLHLKCTASTKTSTIAINHSKHQGGFDVDNCIIDGTDNWNKGFGTTATAAGGLTVRNTQVNNTITCVSDWDTNSQWYNCEFNDNAAGIASKTTNIFMYGCQFNNTAGICIYQTSNPGNNWIITNSIFNGGTNGLHYRTYTQAAASGYVANNVFVNFSGVAIYNTTGRYTDINFINNAFYNNATNILYDYDHHLNNIVLSADPFVDQANRDYRINKTIGGGAVLRSAKALWRG
jgi:hypothetical protein